MPENETPHFDAVRAVQDGFDAVGYWLPKMSLEALVEHIGDEALLKSRHPFGQASSSVADSRLYIPTDRLQAEMNKRIKGVIAETRDPDDR